MPSAAALRFQIETALASRIPSALTPRPRMVREQASTGIAELDALLGGGLPIGAISELVGAQSSGRTTLALATLAEMTQAGKTVAWVDTSDSLDPESAAAAGVDLKRQLWVRCGKGIQPAMAQPQAESHRVTRGAALLVEGSRTAAPSGGCGSPHPRGEAKGLSEAVDAFLQQDVFSRPAPPRDPAVPRRNRMIGTPSAPNRKLLDRTPQDARPLSRRDRQEQVPTDRQPSRRQQLYAQRQEWSNAKTLRASQILHTSDMAAAMPRGGAWTDNQNNAAGRSMATAPNAIAAGLPRFREMEARAQGQGHGLHSGPLQWKPAKDDLQVHAAASPTHAGRGNSDTGLDKQAAPPSESIAQASKASLAGEPPPTLGKAKAALWEALDQALRATDLLLAAGGFSAIVLDLGNIPAEFSWRIPLATWFRFRAAADRARTALVLLTQHPCARSSAELVLRLRSLTPQDATTVLTGAQFHVLLERQRFETKEPPPLAPQEEHGQANRLHLVSQRKPPQREQAASWQRAAAWTGTGPAKAPGGLL